MKEIALIAEILEETTAFVLEKYRDRSHLQVSRKKHVNDLVTEVDLATQDMIVARVRAAFPGDLFAAEERGLGLAPEETERRCWVIDPIDGTQNFVRGLVPSYGISIAFANGGQAVAGGVSIPLLDEVFLAERGAGTTRNGKRTRVSDVARADIARVEVDFSGPPERAATIRRGSGIICGTGQVRCNCATVVALCSIASGDMDAFFHVTLHPWDYAAGQLLVEEAGGRASRLDGTPLRLFDNRQGVLISNGLIHDELLALVE